MQKKYYPILWAVLVLTGTFIYFYSGWDPLLVNLLLINILIFIIRAPIIRLTTSLIKKRIIRIFISWILNIIWIIFAFWLLLTISLYTFIALVSFLVISISLTFKNFINNATSGALLLAAEQFEIGDLIETNNIQGVVKEITLNYTRIQEFDGVSVIIPNKSVYGSSVVKYTHKKFINLVPPKPGASERKIQRYRRYLKYVNKMLSMQPKVTKYVKAVELLSSIDPEKLDSHLSPVFEKYQDVFGLPLDYRVDTTKYKRCRINLYISSKNPELILNNIDAFLRDIIFQLYNDKIYSGWEEYLTEIKPKEVAKK